MLVLLHHPLHLEEPAQPPDLEDGLADNDAEDEQVPPLDSAVGALGGVSVGALSDDNVGLLVLDLRKEIRQFSHWSKKLAGLVHWPDRE